MLWLLLHALATIVVINRYASAMIVRAVRRRGDAVDPHYLPTVTVIMPLFNEGAGVREALASVLAQDYPADRLEVICVDDASTDDSHAHACAVAATDPRLTVIRHAVNTGKRRALIEATRRSRAEIIVSVDSDVILDPDAIRALVRRFTRPEIAAVGGWVDIRNKHASWLTRMQVVQYWYAYFVMKNLERAFERVLHLSGCLTAYRRDVLLALEPVLEARALLGVPIKYGEDRFLSRQLIKAGHLTTLALDARCQTHAPARLGPFLAQALRWRRSNVVDYLGGLTHMWRQHPLLAIHYFSMFAVMLLYPVAVVRALVGGQLLTAIAGHAIVLAGFGLYYRWRVRAWPAERRVGALSFVPHALVMPVTYGLFTPLAACTLDSGSWETRGHGTVATVDDPAP